MTRTRPTALRAIPLLALAALALMPAASATGSAKQVTIMQDDKEIVATTDAHRAERLDEMKALGADVVKIRIDWRGIAPSPDAKKKPAGFNAADSTKYPAHSFTNFDGVIRAIVGRGMRPYILLGGAAPNWAGGKNGRGGHPNAKAFGQFVKAITSRYSGTFSPSAMTAHPLPRVDLWSIWNEPDLEGWISPQYKNGVPVSPHVYRNMLYAARDAMKATGHGSDQMLIGEMLPFANHGNTSDKVRPVKFLRELACVDGSYHPYTGQAAKDRGCTDYKPIPGTGVAQHPYTLSGGPDTSPNDKDDASIIGLGHLVKAIDKLGNAHRLVSPHMPVWISEFGIQTDPPDQYAAPIERVPGYLGEAEWYAYRNPRIASYSQYPLIDDPLDQGSFQSGLRTSDGKKKKTVYREFQYPIFVQRRSDNAVEVFGGVRAGAPGQSVTLESKSNGGSFSALSNGTIKLGAQGYFDRVFQLSNAANRYYRFRYGKASSRTAGVHG